MTAERKPEPPQPLGKSETREGANNGCYYREIDGHAKVCTPSERVEEDEGENTRFEKNDAEN